MTGLAMLTIGGWSWVTRISARSWSVSMSCGLAIEHEGLQRDRAGECQQFKDVALAGAEPVQACLHDVPDLAGQGDGAVAQEP